MAFDPALFILLGCGVNGALATGEFGVNGALATGEFGVMNAVGGIYTLGGVPCAIGDIINLSHPDGNFDPLIDIDAGGVKPKDGGGGSVIDTYLFLKEPLLSQILQGYTAVFEVTFMGDVSSAALEATAFDDPDYNITAGLIASYRSNNTPNRLRFVDTSNNPTDFTDEFVSPGDHKIAFTATDGKMVASVDGRAIKSLASPGLDPACSGFYFAIQDELVARLRSFAFYVEMDDTELPALSAP